MVTVLKQLVWTLRGQRSDGDLGWSGHGEVGGLRRHLGSRVHSDGWDVGLGP